MAVLVDTQLSNLPLYSGDAISKSAETVAQISGRATDIAYATIMYFDSTNKKWGPLQSVTQTSHTAAILLCGANGGNLAAWQAVTAGAFNITVNGSDIAITGLNFSGIAVLDEIAEVVNYAANGRFVCQYDNQGDVFKFLSPNQGSAATISYLTAPAAGTDISGASFFNGLTGTGTLTQGAGTNYSQFPKGILLKTLTAADVAAGDVADVPIIVGGGADLNVDKNQIVLENSLTIDDVITAAGLDLSIEEYLRTLGIFLADAVDVDGFENT